MATRGPVSRRAFLLRTPPQRVLELSCERLYMKYADARSEGRLEDFLRDLAREVGEADHVRLTAREWLARDDFRTDLERVTCPKGVPPWSVR